jgi:hypothetical protein
MRLLDYEPPTLCIPLREIDDSMRTLPVPPPNGEEEGGGDLLIELNGVLRSQCSHRLSRGRRKGERCRHLTRYDYRLCDEHLAKDLGLVVARSRIQGAGMGLYACDYRLLPRRYLRTADERDPPNQRPSHRIFSRDELVGHFAGEIIDGDEYESRYKRFNGFAAYVLGITPKLSHDESMARTALSYANDGVDLADAQLRRNYFHKSGAHVVWHNLSSSAVINTYCKYDREHGRACLHTLGPVTHGEELLWSYSGEHQPSRDERGRWYLEKDEVSKRVVAPPTPVDKYFFGLLHFGSTTAKSFCGDQVKSD